MDPAHIKRQRGAYLLAAIITLVIAGLAIFAVDMLRTRRNLEAVKPIVRLTRIDAALAAFVSKHRRLPCPARGSIASGVSGAGVESINLGTGQCIPANQADGVVPWISLGLVENDALDPWQGRISYRVQPSLASNLLVLMNMSWCDPAATPNGSASATQPCTPSCTTATCTSPLNFLYAKGLPVRDGSGAWLNVPSPSWPGAPTPPPPLATGAAYVLISHGLNGAGAYNSNGGAVQAGASVPGNDEALNLNGQALTGASVFVDAAQVTAAGTSYFDDTLSHPTISQVLSAAALGPRTHP